MSMGNERQRILSLLAEGKISVDEAERLLTAVESPPAPAAEPIIEGVAGKSPPRFFRVVVDEGSKRVNIRIPIQLLRSGIKLSSLLPGEAGGKVGAVLGERGFDLSLGKMGEREIEQMIASLAQLEIDVNDGEETVRVYCE
jgi:SHOCT-like domain